MSLTFKVGTFKKTLPLSTEAQLILKIFSGDEVEVARILEKNKELVNSKDRNGGTALHYACLQDSYRVVNVLLAHSDIDVNPKDNAGATPFMVACREGKTACVQLLLEDARVNIEEPSKKGYSPLYYAARNGHLGVIVWWIVSGREMDLGQPGNRRNDAIRAAQKHGHAEVLKTLEIFRARPEAVRERVRKELGCFDELAAERFALVVFLSDGLLKRRMEGLVEMGFSRFFAIASRLPIELQMILCHRVVGSAGEIIPAVQRERAFGALAQKLLQ